MGCILLAASNVTRIAPLREEVGPPLVQLGVIPQVFVSATNVTVNNKFRRSQSVHDSCGLRLVEHEAVLIFKHVF